MTQTMQRLAVVLVAIGFILAGAVPAVAEPDLGTRWDVTNNLGWTGVWTRRGDSNMFDGYWTHPQHGAVVAELRIMVDAGNRVFIERREITSDTEPPGWAPGLISTYQGVIDPGSGTASGTLTAPWAPGPYTWSARISGARLEVDAIALIRAVQRQDSSAFKANVDPRLEMQTASWDTTPYLMTSRFTGDLRVDPGRRVFLAGDARGTTGWGVDNFLFIEIGQGASATRLVVGNHDPVLFGGVPVRKLGANKFSFGAGEIDLTGFFPAGAAETLSVSAMDYGGVGYVTDVFLVLK